MTDFVRTGDGAAAHDGAAKMLTVRAKHRGIALAIYARHEQPLSAQDVRGLALAASWVNTISSAESVRRRVIELHHEGLLDCCTQRGPSGAQFVLSERGRQVWEARQ